MTPPGFRPPWGFSNYVGFLASFIGYYILGMIFVVVSLGNDRSPDSELYTDCAIVMAASAILAFFAARPRKIG
jgi:hypothetical protein